MAHEQHVATLIQRLVDNSKPEPNDIKLGWYVLYSNNALGYFGKERAHLVGSTREKLKLRTSKDGGDADIIFCSGKLEIPVKNLEFKSDTPCYVWVKGHDLNVNPNIRLVNGVYFPSQMLREVHPELFTILRALYSVFTSTTDMNQGEEGRYTTTRIKSKVGLAFTHFYNLQTDGRALPDVASVQEWKQQAERSRVTEEALKKRKKAVKLNKVDMDKLLAILKFVATMRPNERIREYYNGFFPDFAHAVQMALNRQMREDDSLATKEKTDQQCYSTDPNQIASDTEDSVSNATEDRASTDNRSAEDTVSDTECSKGERANNDECSPNIVATYRKKKSKDFVPAVRIVGKLECMEEWNRRQRAWPDKTVVDDVYNSEVYIVSRFAPVKPDYEKDFCLSFNQAEMKLSDCLTEVQRKVCLVLKSFLKGVYATEHDKRQRKLQLTTFHLKTLMYWVLEKEDVECWSEHNIIPAVKQVLRSLRNALSNKCLMHYFIASNLFAGFAEEDFDLLLECTSKVLSNPIAGIQAYFDLDDGFPVFTMLTNDEVMSLQELGPDGGQTRNADVVEDMLIDVQRGLNEGPRDAHGNAPIEAAIMSTAMLAYQHEGLGKSDGDTQRLNFTRTSTSDVVSGILNTINQLTNMKNEPSNEGSPGTNENMTQTLPGPTTELCSDIDLDLRPLKSSFLQPLSQRGKSNTKEGSEPSCPSPFVNSEPCAVGSGTTESSINSELGAVRSGTTESSINSEPSRSGTTEPSIQESSDMNGLQDEHSAGSVGSPLTGNAARSGDSNSVSKTKNGRDFLESLSKFLSKINCADEKERYQVTEDLKAKALTYFND